MPLNAFIIRPFGCKPLTGLSARVEALDGRDQMVRKGLLVQKPLPGAAAGALEYHLNFDEVHRLLIGPALRKLHITGATTSAVVEAGNIREDMFSRLLTADLVIVDLSVDNPNVYYELGLRQAFRDKYTFLIRNALLPHPFDLQTDRYFDYELSALVGDAIGHQVERLTEALRRTLASYKADSPVFKLLPGLDAEERGRFISVPADFLEEVERAQTYRQREHLAVLAVECNQELWEIEGLRAVGRAQFACNFINGAKITWERIVQRYPDDLESNTILSTVYQRTDDGARSDQALARARSSRKGALTPARRSELTALTGRNYKEAWVRSWKSVRKPEPGDVPERQLQALRSPLLQRSCDAFLRAFKDDLNHTYAGLNALTLLTIQTELAMRFPTEWARMQASEGQAHALLAQARGRIRTLVEVLNMALEAERDTQDRDVVDPWFSLTSAVVACITSDKPQYVRRLFEDARQFAPVNAEDTMRQALEIYQDLGIRGRPSIPEVGTIQENVTMALNFLRRDDAEARRNNIGRIILFLGLRLDGAGGLDTVPSLEEAGAIEPWHDDRSWKGFAAADEALVAQKILAALKEECLQGSDGHTQPLAIASGAQGGDLLFHEACRSLGIPVQMCLPLPRAQHIGRYVATAGEKWVDRFFLALEHAQSSFKAKVDHHSGLGLQEREPVHVFSDAQELPRWLSSRVQYNVGRRNNLWMLYHALALANDLGGDARTQVTMIALTNGQVVEPSELGGIRDVCRLAMRHGVKVRVLTVAPSPGPAMASVSLNGPLHQAQAVPVMAH